MKAIERIYKYIDIKGLKIAEFERKNSLSNGYLKKMLQRKADIGESILNSILENSPDISAEWLLTGNGSMLKSEIKEAGEVVKVNADEQQAIPLVNVNAVAGFGNDNFAIAREDVKDYYVIPKFRHCKVDFMIELSGNSMYPQYNSGDVVACTVIKESRFIQWNRVHIIATKEQGIMCKRIQQGTEGHIKAVSVNPDYPPFEVPVSEITGLALVCGVIRLE